MVNKPIFFSCQIGSPGVYSKFCNVDNSYDKLDVYVGSIIRYIKNNKQLIGISIYGSSLNNPKVLELLQICKERNLQVAVDLSCNDCDVEFFYKNISYINVVRILLYSLDHTKHNNMFDGNNHKNLLKFVDGLTNKKIGKVVVIPVTNDNYDELIQISDWAHNKKFKINPLPVPKCCGSKVNVLGKENFKTFLKCLQVLQKDLGDELYLDTPVGYEYFNKPCVCPSFRLSFDVCGNLGIRSCKFSENFLGKIEDVNMDWAVYKNLWRKSNQCLKCSDFDKCGGGCICNKYSIGERDFYCSKK